MANSGANKLGRVLQGRIKKLGDIPPGLEYGEIQANMGLVTNSFPRVIPQSDYMVCASARRIKLSGSQQQNIEYEGLSPGDRVLVAWAGGDACVIDKIMTAVEAAKTSQT